MRTRGCVCIGLLTLGALAAPAANGLDVPIPVRVYLNRPGTKTTFVAKGTFPLPDPGTDNPVSEGGEITFSQAAVSETIALPAVNWKALGTPPGAKGFRYADPSGATCKKVRVKNTSIKGICRPTAPGAPPVDPDSDPPISIVLSTGTVTQRYCAECPNGGLQKGNPQQLTKFRDCMAPASCPVTPPTPTASATPTHTPPATPTHTPEEGGLCCDYPTGCSSTPSEVECIKLAGGSPVGGGAVCDASGDCVAPPGSPGPCCEGLGIFSVCTTDLDRSTCESTGGTFHGSAICEPSSVCTPMCPSDASACTAFSVPAGPCRTCCGGIGSCATACAAAEASSCADAPANASCADQINAGGCADECCP